MFRVEGLLAGKRESSYGLGPSLNETIGSLVEGYSWVWWALGVIVLLLAACSWSTQEPQPVAIEVSLGSRA